MRLMPIGGYIERNSPIHKMDAFVKLINVFILIWAVVFAESIMDYFILIGIIIVIPKLSKIGYKKILSGLNHLWLFFAIVFLMNAVFFETDQTIWNWWIFRFSVEGITKGLNMVLRVILAMVLGNILVSVTTPLDITGAIESMIFPLKYIGVPIQDVAMIIGISIQFVPNFIKETEMIKKAQIARGARFESKRIAEKVKSVIPLIVPIFIAVFRRADELSVAMEARGYRRAKKIVKYESRKLSLMDVFSVVMCSTIFLIEVVT